MDMRQQTDEKLMQALIDIGCDAALIQKFIKRKAEGNMEAGIQLLSQYRCKLLCQIHEAQKPLDILDYLIYQLKRRTL